MATWAATQAARLALSCSRLAQFVFFCSGCCFRSTACLILHFLFVPLFAGSFAGHFNNMIVPYRQPPKLHFNNTVPHQLPLRLTVAMRLPRNTRVFFFCNAIIIIQKIQMFLRYDVQIHTNIHTYIQTLLVFNMLMWGSFRLAPITE